MNTTHPKLSSFAGRLSLLAALVALVSGCGEQNTYVLVHGAFQGGWAWDKVKPQLEKEGHKVVTVDLPGHGADTTAFSEINLQSYTDRGVAAIDAQEGPVVLVGHSMGGTVVSNATEARPDKVEKVIYVAAYLLRDGETLLQTTESDTESQLGPSLVFENGGATARVKPENIVSIFCADCPESEAARILANPVSEPLAPLTQPVKVTEANYGRVPRFYIETTQDRTVGNALQKRMYTATPVQKVITMDTGHSPFLSQPETLARHLLSL
jgi:pimeloyl-ACP methyl ester carboxylesterase